MKYLLTGTVAARFLWHLKRNQWKTLQELKNIQLKRLKAMIHYVYNYVPYYHSLFNSVKFKPEDLKSFEDLQKVPITTKMDVQRNLKNIIAKGVDTSKCIEYFTTGSTGIPLKTYKNLRAASQDTALKAYAFLECGMRLTDKFVNIFGARSTHDRSIDRTTSSMILPNQILLPYAQKTSVIIDYLRRIKPDVIYSFPSVLEDLCSCDASKINPRLIFSQGETLTQHCRSLVRSAFDVEINDTYGSTELGRLAFECNENSGLHMITDSNAIEFIDDYGDTVAPGEIGEIVATGLYNYAMPMVRYNLGDIGIPTDERCCCGRSWPLIKDIEGRINDVFIMPRGRKLYPRILFSLFIGPIIENPFFISQYQIIQKKRNKIVVRMVKGREFDLKMAFKIKDNIENFCFRMGEDISVDLEIVQNILGEKTNKRKHIISLIGQHN